jgi:hypothetical protein
MIGEQVFVESLSICEDVLLARVELVHSSMVLEAHALILDRTDHHFSVAKPALGNRGADVVDTLNVI